jgi:predicted ATPase
MPITELRIEGLRTIKKLRLKLDGLTVLIGDNGAGKSSIIEACEILRRATSERFIDEFYRIHGGLPALLRQGASQLELGVTIQLKREEYPQFKDSDFYELFKFVEYNLTIKPSGTFATIGESIRVQFQPSYLARYGNLNAKDKIKFPTPKQWVPVLEQANGGVDYLAVLGGGVWDVVESKENVPIISNIPLDVSTGTPGHSAAQAVLLYLQNIQVHLPFEVTSAWASRALDRKSALRTSEPLAPAQRLEKLGLNLANAFHALKNNFGQEHWQRTLDYIRLGLGEHIEDISTVADPGGGSIGLWVKFKNMDRQIPASQLSDGMLTYLAFVALFRLQATPPSLMALDEPDLHLHPKLLMRVLDMFESMARGFPVLVATHSDRLLDGLSDPARSVVLCELDEHQATRLLRPNPRVLAQWLERYRGIGDIRGAGHEASVLTRKEPT